MQLSTPTPRVFPTAHLTIAHSRRERPVSVETPPTSTPHSLCLTRVLCHGSQDQRPEKGPKQDRRDNWTPVSVALAAYDMKANDMKVNPDLGTGGKLQGLSRVQGQPVLYSKTCLKGSRVIPT